MSKEQIKGDTFIGGVTVDNVKLGLYPGEYQDLMKEMEKISEKDKKNCNNCDCDLSKDSDEFNFNPRKISSWYMDDNGLYHVTDLDGNEIISPDNITWEMRSQEEIDVRNIRIKVYKDQNSNYTVKLQDPLSGEFIVCDNVEVEEIKKPTKVEIDEFIKKLGYDPEKCPVEVRNKAIEVLKRINK